MNYSLMLPVFLAGLSVGAAAGFDTLADCRAYAAQTASYELFAAENSDFVDPSFSGVFKLFTPGYFDRLWTWFGRSTAARWSIEDMRDALRDLCAQKGARPAVAPGAVSAQLQLPADSRVYVWGDLYGSFHSFVRCLEELQRQGILDDQLHIVAPNTYCVVLGDTVGRSAFSLQLLTLLANLMQKNPGTFIILAGKQEQGRYWENFISMRMPLRLLASAYADPGKDRDIPLSGLINEFFTQLSPTLRIACSKNPADFMLCTQGEIADGMLDLVHLKAIIGSEQWLQALKPSRGLDFIGFTRGIPQWSLISAFNYIYQKYFNFSYDAFVLLSLKDNLADSMLSLHCHDMKNAAGPFAVHNYHPLWGVPVDGEADIKRMNALPVVTVGSTLPLTGALRGAGRAIQKGLELGFLQSNEQPKARFLVRPILLDDANLVRLARINALTLLKTYQCNIIIAPFGSSHLYSFMDLVQDGKVLVLFPASGNAIFRKPELKNIIHLRCSYDSEARGLAKYMVEQLEIKRFCLVYQDDLFGKPLTEAFQDELKKHQIDESTAVPFSRLQTTFKKEIELIKASNPEAVGLFTTSSSVAQEIISQLGTEFFIGRRIFGLSLIYDEALSRFLIDRGIPSTFSYIMPDPKRGTIVIVKEYRVGMERYGFVPESNSLDGYVAASLLVHALEHLEPPYTKEKVRDYFESLKGYAFKDLGLTFDPSKRQFIRPMLLRSEDDRWFRYDSAQNVLKPFNL
jgi:ABC-type branched-subunit amino acid transport system substrate-binding protein